MIPNFYTDDQKALQAQFDAQKLAHVMNKAVIAPTLTAPQQAFIGSRDMFFLATVDSNGHPTCSYKGGEPGFVHVVDASTLMFPLYDGNGMFLSAGNMQSHAHVGLLFIDFETPNRLRVQGNAALRFDAASLAEFPGADIVAHVQIEAVFVNCSRHVHPHRRVATSRYSPRDGVNTPHPEWKRIDAFQSALVPRDAGRTAEAGGPITFEDYASKLARGDA